MRFPPRARTVLDHRLDVGIRLPWLARSCTSAGGVCLRPRLVGRSATRTLMRPREPGGRMSGIWPFLHEPREVALDDPEIRAASGRYTIRSASDRIADSTLVAAHSRARAGPSAPKDTRSSVALARM